MGEAKRRAMANGDSGEPGQQPSAEITLDEMLKRAKPVTVRKICPLPLMNFRPSMLVSAMGGDGRESAVPALPCLGEQCILYSEGIIQTDQGLQRVAVCGLGSAGFAISQNLAPTVGILAKGIGEALAAHEERLLARVTDAVANVVADFVEGDDLPDEVEPGAQSPVVATLEALMPKKAD